MLIQKFLTHCQYDRLYRKSYKEIVEKIDQNDLN